MTSPISIAPGSLAASVVAWSRASCSHRLSPPCWSPPKLQDHDPSPTPLPASCVEPQPCWSASVASSVAANLLDAWAVSGWKRSSACIAPAAGGGRRNGVAAAEPVPPRSSRLVSINMETRDRHLVRRFSNKDALRFQGLLSTTERKHIGQPRPQRCAGLAETLVAVA